MKFDRAKWLNPSTYGLSDELLKKTVDHNTWLAHSWNNEWVANIDANIEQAISDGWITTEYGKWSGPALVLGAGPSLVRDMESVKLAYVMGYKIICVDRAYQTLKDNHIRPFMVVADDAQEVVKEFFREGIDADYFSPQINIHPEVLNVGISAKTLWHGPINPFTWFWQLARQKYGDDICTNLVGSVVTCTAVDIAAWMGFDVILDGCDLKFSSMEDAIQNCNEADIVVMEDGTISSKTFIMVAQHELAAAPMFHPDKTFVDMSKGILTNWQKGEFNSEYGKSFQKAG